MNKIIICYQVNKNSDTFNYTAFDKLIKDTYTNWAKPMNSVFFIKTRQTPNDVMSYIAQFLDKDDTLRCDLISIHHQGWISKDIISRLND